MSVVVVEPRRGILDKACGEGIMPRGVRALESLGVEVRGRPLHGILYTLADDPRVAATGDFPGAPALGVRRVVLHEALHRRACALGVAFREGRVTTVEQDERGVRAGGIEARWLVAADGLHSEVRRSLGLELRPRRPARFGVRRHFAAPPSGDRVEVHFAGRAEAYVTPLGPNLVGVALLFEPPGTFDVLLRRFPVLADRLAGCRAVTTTRGAGPFEQRVARRVAGRVLLAGDAAGYLDPLTGEGVALGVESAIGAVESILEGRLESYEARWSKLTRRTNALTAALLAIARRPLLQPPLIRAAAAVPWAFDATLGVLAGDRAITRSSTKASSAERRRRVWSS